MAAQHLSGLNWTGGKSYLSAPQGRWVASMLPQTTSCCYVEPFAGMAGVLLQRPPSTAEILNDTDMLLINWWLQVRDNTSDLIDKLELTPHSRFAYDAALSLLDEGSEDMLAVAAAWTIAIDQSVSKTLSLPGWSASYNISRGRGHELGYWQKKLTALAGRLAKVQLENRPASELLGRLAAETSAVIYCDPPYYTAGKNFYKNAELDVEGLAEVLGRQQGRVAISGYGSEWDCLGWNKYLCPGLAAGSPVSSRLSAKQERREVLWCNYEATEQTQIFGFDEVAA